MKKLFAVLVVALIVVGVVGFSRGWFTVTRDSQPDGTNVNLHIDKEKIAEDKDTVGSKFNEFRDDVREDTEALEAEQ